MRSSRPVLIISMALVAVSSSAQTNYNDVAVIVNVNDPVSVNIGNYFQAARSIPAANMILIDAPLSEAIDSMQFTLIRQQIEDHLIANDLVDSINFIVCTKGVPHKVEIGDCDALLPNRCSSFDSEITLLLGPYTTAILTSGILPSPYFGSFERQQRAQTGLYLVTRLDGYDEDDVFDLIDRSGPAQPADMANAVILGDISHASYPINTLYSQMVYYLDPLVTAGWNVVTDSAQAPVGGLNDVLGLLSIEMAPVPGALTHTWNAGSLANEINSFAAYSFNASTPDPVKTRVADLISEGVSGMRGAVTHAYANSGLEMRTTLKRYVDTLGFNLAESYYAGIPWLSFTDVVIGDPKTSIVVSNTMGIEQVTADPFLVYHDAVNAALVVSPPDGVTGSYLLQVFDPIGRTVVQQRMQGAARLSTTALSSGVYVVRVSVAEEVKGMMRFVKDR